MNGKQLKNSILQWAIQGKLVPQDPNDEPASVLLEKIRAEKARLVKEGKLKKKDLEVKPIAEDEIPFEIPKGWEWVRLKNLVSILGDGIHGTPEYDSMGDYYFINGNNLSKNKIVLKADTKRVNEIEHQKYKKELSDKTVLVSINGTIGNVGHYNGEPVILGKSACYFNLINIELKDYITLLMYTDYFLKYAIENATGSTIKNVSLAVMNEFLLPLPPLAEQHRIVAKIEELMPLVEKYGETKEALEEWNNSLPEKLKKSILLEAIQGRLVPQDPTDEPASALLERIREEKQRLVKEGKLKKKDLEVKPIEEDEIPFEIPESWEWCRMNQCCVRIFSGKSPVYSKTPTKQLIIGQQANQWDGIKMQYVKYGTDEFVNTIEDYQYLLDGDVLLNTLGNGTLGRCGIFENIEYKVLTDGHLFVFRTIAKELSKYILFFLTLNYLEINKNADGSTNQTFLNLKKVSNYLIPLPPINEIRRIVEKKEELFGVIKK